jgi:hypothetical protein
LDLAEESRIWLEVLYDHIHMIAALIIMGNDPGRKEDIVGIKRATHGWRYLIGSQSVESTLSLL